MNKNISRQNTYNNVFILMTSSIEKKIYYLNIPIDPWGPSAPILISSKFGSYTPCSPSIPCIPGIPGRPSSPSSP